MKAAVLRTINEPMAIEDVDIALPIGREVLVRVAAVGLCHSDLHVFDGSYPNVLPAILGHEVAGVVERIGPDVSRVRVGDHVVLSLSFFCGHCEHCTGRQSAAMRNAGSLTQAGRTAARKQGRRSDRPVHADRRLCRTDAGTRERLHSDRPRRPARQGLPDRLRGDHRLWRCRAHRRGARGRPGGGNRLWRCRAFGDQRRGDCRSQADHRRRPGAGETGQGAGVRRNRCGRRFGGGRRGGGGAGTDR